jgi:hypothetical protein
MSIIPVGLPLLNLEWAEQIRMFSLLRITWSCEQHLFAPSTTPPGVRRVRIDGVVASIGLAPSAWLIGQRGGERNSGHDQPIVISV